MISVTALLFSVFGILLAVFYRWKSRIYLYFLKQGIPGPEPIFFFGNLWKSWKIDVRGVDMADYKKYGKVYGKFDGFTPNLYIVDPEMIKQVFIKDFDHFVNRKVFATDQKYERKMLTMATGHEWKQIRSSFSPTFTSGKIKKMSLLMGECGDRLCASWEALAESNKSFSPKEEFAMYTIDVIATACFGINTRTGTGEEDRGVFFEMAKKTFASSAQLSSSPLIVLPFIFPELLTFAMRSLNKTMEFFINTAKSLVEERKFSSKEYHDFIQIALETKKERAEKGIHFSEDEIEEAVVAQSVLFFLAGFETVGQILTMLSYTLAINQEVQEKLYEAINETIGEEEVTHDIVNSIDYLDEVIKEVLRMYPTVRVDRQCNKAIKYGSIEIQEGTLVTVPVYTLHHLSEYYEEPEKFKPERWNSENRGKINKYAYMPFGLGPRNCIGERFALEEVKFAVCKCLQKYRFVPSRETPIPLVFPNGMFGMIPNDYIKLSVEFR